MNIKVRATNPFLYVVRRLMNHCREPYVTVHLSNSHPIPFRSILIPGGRLIFATSDGVLLTPQRSVGTATLHNCTVVHGVSAHTKGVRYGLFFIKEPPLQQQ